MGFRATLIKVPTFHNDHSTTRPHTQPLDHTQHTTEMAVASYDYLFRCLVIGDSGVGKSNLLLRYTDNLFSDSYISTIGVDFRFHHVEGPEKERVKLQIWDTAGQERFAAICRTFYRGTHGIMLTYDITDRKSFASLTSRWLKEIGSYADPNVALILVGNKADLDDARVVSYEEGAEFAAAHNMRFLETSAKSDYGVDDAFENLVHTLLEDQQHKLSGTPKLPLIGGRGVDIAKDGGGDKSGGKCAC